MTTGQSVSTPSNLALGFIVVCLVIYLLHVAAAIMIPFMIALFVWYLINALARGFGRLRLGRFGLPRFLCFLFSILLLVAGMWLVYKVITLNAAEVMRAAPEYERKFREFLPTVVDMIPAAYRPDTLHVAEFLNVGGLITGLVKTFTGIAGKTLVVLFYTGFLLYEQRFFDRKIVEMIEDQGLENRVRHILKNIDINMQRYIWVKVAVSAMTGLGTYGILYYFNVDFNQFWGLMAFILNFIPYVGSLLAIALPSVIALAQFTDLSVFFGVVACLSVLQIALGSILDPRLLGDSLNLSPIMIIFSLAAWGLIWGVPGMFLSIPILAMIVITLSQFDRTRPIAILLSKTGELEAHSAASVHPRQEG